MLTFNDDIYHVETFAMCLDGGAHKKTCILISYLKYKHVNNTQVF